MDIPLSDFSLVRANKDHYIDESGSHEAEYNLASGIGQLDLPIASNVLPVDTRRCSSTNSELYIYENRNDEAEDGATSAIGQHNLLMASDALYFDTRRCLSINHEQHIDEGRNDEPDYSSTSQSILLIPSDTLDTSLNTGYYLNIINEQYIDEGRSHETEYVSGSGTDQYNLPLPNDASHTSLDTRSCSSTNNEQHVDEGRSQRITFDTGSGTKLLCILATCVGTILAIASISYSSYFLRANPDTKFAHFHISPFQQKALLFAINIVITSCITGMMFTHDVSLRWALYGENRLEYNTNIRLFTSSKKSGPNRWYSNLALLISLALSHGSLSALLFPAISAIEHPNNKMWSDATILNITALLVLGITLGVQAAISIWCLVSGRHSILSWSSNPLNTTLALIQRGSISYNPGRCLLSVHQRHQWSSQLICPENRQGSIIQAHRRTQHILIVSWALATISVLWAIATAIASSRLGDSEVQKCWRLGFDWAQNILPCSTNSIDLSLLSESSSPLSNSSALEILLYIFILSIPHSTQAIGLHLGELIVNLSRDESVWQQAYHDDAIPFAPGAQIFTSPLKTAISSPAAMVLFIFKIVSSWALGQSIFLSAYYKPIRTDADHAFRFQFTTIYPRLIVYAGLGISYATFATYIAVRRPRSYQPAALGHLQTLANLIDDWETNDDGRLWWGDKSIDIRSDVRYAGTSSKKELLSQICSSGEYH